MFHSKAGKTQVSGAFLALWLFGICISSYTTKDLPSVGEMPSHIGKNNKWLLKGLMVVDDNQGVDFRHTNPCTPLELQSVRQPLWSQLFFQEFLFSSVHLQFLPQETIVSTFGGKYIYGKEIKFHSPISHHIFLSSCSSFSIIFNRVKL